MKNKRLLKAPSLFLAGSFLIMITKFIIKVNNVFTAVKTDDRMESTEIKIRN